MFNKEIINRQIEKIKSIIKANGDIQSANLRLQQIAEQGFWQEDELRNLTAQIADATGIIAEALRHDALEVENRTPKNW